MTSVEDKFNEMLDEILAPARALIKDLALDMRSVEPLTAHRSSSHIISWQLSLAQYDPSGARSCDQGGHQTLTVTYKVNKRNRRR